MSATIHPFPREVSDFAEARRTIDEVKRLISALAPLEEVAAVLNRYADTRNVASPTVPPPTAINPQEKA